MNTEAMVDRIEAACREMGMSQSTIQTLKTALPPDLPKVVETAEENRRLREELEQIRRQRQQMMELLETKTPEKLVHDLRNVLNELTLLRALNDRDE